MVSSICFTSKIRADHPGICCVEMEVRGFTSALRRHSVGRSGAPIAGFIVRGISDYAEKKVSEEGARAAACRNATTVAALLALEIITSENSDLRDFITRKVILPSSPLATP